MANKIANSIAIILILFGSLLGVRSCSLEEARVIEEREMERAQIRNQVKNRLRYLKAVEGE